MSKTIEMLKLDEYTWGARLLPCLLVLLPLVLAIWSWIPADRLPFVFIWSLLGLMGFTYLLTQLARDQGYQIQPRLWREWGGKPTNQLLRHCGGENKVTLQRRHTKLGFLIARSFPTEIQESDSLESADEIYDAAIDVLRDKTRDQEKFPLIFKENVSYAFRRNLYGMRPAGIAIAAIGLVASIASGIYHAQLGSVDLLPWISSVITASLLTWWLLRINSAWVKIPAFEYARRLLESCERL
jgi:hypothetical protein